MRCFLIATNKAQTPYPVYPLALACLAGALIEAGHEVEQFDCLGQQENVRENLAAAIERFQPELVGLSIRNLDSEDSALPESFLQDATQIMGWVRDNTPAPVIIGGAAFSLMPERIVNLLQPDFGIVGEGERLLVELADSLANNMPPAEKILRSPLAKAPWKSLSFDREISSYYLKRGGILNVQTKRGCPYRCAYCSYPLLEGKQIRTREPEAVVDDVLRLERDFQARYIFFTDSVFNDPGGSYLEVCEALIRRGNKLPWTGYFRPTRMKREHMDIMKRSGLDAMEVGTDCGCDATLASVKKDFTFDDVISFHELATEFKIPCAHFIMFGAPGENRETVRESLDNLERLDPAVLMAFNGIRILPRTGIHARAIADGIIDENQDLLEPTYYFSPEIQPGEIDTLIQKSWRNRPDRICPGASDTQRVAMFHKKGFTGPIWDKIIRMGWK
ncbi:MAG: cobalamin-dependent protein [Desulfobulbaceae bacterium]|nr:cobalamin-dependent protein [Desulfobulbaceae bacterium]